MKIQKTIMISAIAGLFMTGFSQAVELNIETGKDISGKRIQSNSVNVGKVVVNGKVIQGASRKMTKKEQKELVEELNRETGKIDKDMLDMESEMEGMFD